MNLVYMYPNKLVAGAQPGFDECVAQPFSCHAELEPEPEPEAQPKPQPEPETAEERAARECAEQLSQLQAVPMAEWSEAQTLGSAIAGIFRDCVEESRYFCCTLAPPCPPPTLT